MSQQQQNINDDDLLEKAIEEMDNKLNLTADEKDDDDMNDEKIEKEYLQFMQGLQGGGQGQDNDMDPMVNQLTNMMSEMLKNINEEAKDVDQGATGTTPPQGQADMINQMKSMFEKFENNPNMEQFADHLLHQFMEKDILEEPLKEAKANYQTYLEKNQNILPQTEFERFKNQQICLEELLARLQSDPANKEELVKLFEKMQEYGNPPADVFGADSPLTMMNQIGSQENPQQQQGEQDCKIF